jgi:hypothetical protein
MPVVNACDQRAQPQPSQTRSSSFRTADLPVPDRRSSGRPFPCPPRKPPGRSRQHEKPNRDTKLLLPKRSTQTRPLAVNCQTSSNSKVTTGKPPRQERA